MKSKSRIEINSKVFPKIILNKTQEKSKSNSFCLMKSASLILFSSIAINCFSFTKNVLAQTQTTTQCLDSYKVQQKFLSHKISTQDLKDLSELAIAGDAIFGWKKLSLLGDSYAELAFQVLNKKEDSNNDSYWGVISDVNMYQKLIIKHWKVTVGPENFELYFKKLAALHFKQYVDIVLTGYWPDSDQILLSYLTAARYYKLPDEVVFDATWDASGLNTINSWQSLNHLDSDRTIYPTNVCYGIPKAKALKIIARDFAPF